MNKDILELEVSKGEEYQRVYETYFMPIYDDLRAKILTNFETSNSLCGELLEKMKLELDMLNTIKSEFQNKVDTGKMASIELSKLQEKA